MTIEQLINDCKKKNTNAQEQLYKLFAPKLFAVCLKYSRNYAEAQDNLHDGFILIFEKIDQFNFKGSFEGWLKRVMVNLVLQGYRTEKIFDLVEENTAKEVEIDIEESDVSLEYLTKIIQELPDRYRMVFSLYVLDGYSHKDISSMLAISEGTSKSNLSRAKQILKNKIESNNTIVSLPKIK